jgi:hypothetical protein
MILPKKAGFCLAVLLAIFQTTTFAADEYLGAADLNGDGVQEKIYKRVNSLIVMNSNNTFQSYFVSTLPWSLLNGMSSVMDLDGVPGAEVPIRYAGGIMVVVHKTAGFSTYLLTVPGWSLLGDGIRELNGVAGNEIALKYGNSVYIIDQKKKGTLTFMVSGGTWNLKEYANTDGKPGLEIIVLVGTLKRTINYRLGGFQ